MDKQKGVIHWYWESGKIYSLSNQKGLNINETGSHIWKIERGNEDEIYYPEKVGFLMEPTTNSPGLEIYVATPFKGIIIIEESGDEIPANRIISSNALYACSYVVMGYEKVIA